MRDFHPFTPLRWGILLLLGSLHLLGSAEEDLYPPDNDEDSPTTRPRHISSRAPDQGDIHPEEDNGFLNGPDYDYLDDTKNQVYLTFAENLQIVDSVVSGGMGLSDNTFQNRFRLLPYLVYDKKDNTKLEPKLDYSASIHFRRLQKKIHLIIDNGDLAPLPNTQPDEEDSDPQVGLQRRILHYTSVKVGAQVRWPPVGYAIASWSQPFELEHWQIQPRYDVFYQTDDDQFGTGGNLLFGRWWGKNTFGLDSGFRITEATTGIEWASAATLGHVVRLIDPEDPQPLVSARAYNEGINLIYRISGHISGHKTIDEHRVIVNYRHPLRKNWLFLFISPEINWKRSNNWGPEIRLRAGMDILFWGVTR